LEYLRSIDIHESILFEPVLDPLFIELEPNSIVAVEIEFGLEGQIG